MRFEMLIYRHLKTLWDYTISSNKTSIGNLENGIRKNENSIKELEEKINKLEEKKQDYR